jgi:hypothetical protein
MPRFLRRLWATLGPTRARLTLARHRHRVRPSRPQLEALEDRLVLSLAGLPGAVNPDRVQRESANACS